MEPEYPSSESANLGQKKVRSGSLRERWRSAIKEASKLENLPFAVLFLSGAVWLIADSLKDSENGELWQQVAATLLMTHGGSAMITLMVLGALVPVHMRFGWRARKNLSTGIVMATVAAILIVTAFGLRPTSDAKGAPWLIRPRR